MEDEDLIGLPAASPLQQLLPIARAHFVRRGRRALTEPRVFSLPTPAPLVYAGVKAGCAGATERCASCARAARESLLDAAILCVEFYRVMKCRKNSNTPLNVSFYLSLSRWDQINIQKNLPTYLNIFDTLLTKLFWFVFLHNQFTLSQCRSLKHWCIII